MSIKFPEIKAFDTAQFEAFTTAANSSTKGLQAIAAETTDYSKKSFEKTRELCEKLVGVKKIEEAIKLQSDFAKSAYEDLQPKPPRWAGCIRASPRNSSSRSTPRGLPQPSVVAEPWKAPATASRLRLRGLARHI